MKQARKQRAQKVSRRRLRVASRILAKPEKRFASEKDEEIQPRSSYTRRKYFVGMQAAIQITRRGGRGSGSLGKCWTLKQAIFFFHHGVAATRRTFANTSIPPFHACISLSLFFSFSLSFETTRCPFAPLSTRRYEFSHAPNRKLFLPPASPTLEMFFTLVDKKRPFSLIHIYIYMCISAGTHACAFVARISSFFSFSFFFLFFIFSIVNPKSTFYISRRIYSKRIFFGQIDALKNADIRTVTTICDSRGLLRNFAFSLRLVYIARVYTRDNGKRQSSSRSNHDLLSFSLFLLIFFRMTFSFKF